MKAVLKTKITFLVSVILSFAGLVAADLMEGGGC